MTNYFVVHMYFLSKSWDFYILWLNTIASNSQEDSELFGKRSAATSEADEVQSKKLKKEDMRLDSFLSKYQSEDDASFSELVEKDQQKHREKYSWLHNKEEEQNAAAEKQLALTDSEGVSMQMKAIEYRQAGVDTWTYTAKNSLMYIPGGMEVSVKEALKNVTKPREIVHQNTRLSKEFLVKAQKTFAGSNVSKKDAVPEKVGVDGLVVNPNDAPTVKGYGFVATPDIRPGI